MKKNLITKALSIVFCFVTGFATLQSCNDKAGTSPNPSNTMVRSNLTGVEQEEIIANNADKLRAVERVIALGLLDISVKPQFVEVVHLLTDSTAKANEHADWLTSLASIAHHYNQSGNMAAEMKASLEAHGGSNADLELLQSCLWSINVEGVLITTNIRLSYKDGMYDVNPTHAIATTQLHSVLADPTWVYNGSSFEATTKTIAELDQMQTWTVNLLLADGGMSARLYTEPNPQPENPEICLFCRCHYSTQTGYCQTYDLGRRCSCRANDIPAPSVCVI